MGYNTTCTYMTITNVNSRCYICNSEQKDMYAYRNFNSPLICKECASWLHSHNMNSSFHDIVKYVDLTQKNNIETVVTNYKEHISKKMSEEAEKERQEKMKQIIGNNLSVLYNIIKKDYPSLTHPLLSNQFVFAENKLNMSKLVQDDIKFVPPLLKLFDFSSICDKDRLFEIYLNSEAQVIILEYLLLVSRNELEQIIKNSIFFKPHHEFKINDLVEELLEIVSAEYEQFKKYKQNPEIKYNPLAIESAFNIWLKANTKFEPKKDISYNNESHHLIMLRHFSLTPSDILAYVNNKLINLNPITIKVMVEKQLDKQFYNSLLELIYADSDYLSFNSLCIILYYLDSTKYDISIERLIKLLSIPSQGMRKYGYQSPISQLYREYQVTQEDILNKVLKENLFLSKYTNVEIQMIMWTLLASEYYTDFIYIYEASNITDNIKLNQYYKIHKSNISNNKRT